MLLPKPLGEEPSWPFQLLASLAFLGLWQHHCNLASIFTWPSYLCVCVSSLFIRMAVMQDEGHTSLQYGLIFNYTCIVPIFK